MSRSQDRWVVAATVAVESAWIFASLGVLGAIVGLDSSPMRWPTVLVTLGASLLVSKLTPSYVTAAATAGVGVVALAWLGGPAGWTLFVVAMGLTAALAYFRPVGGLSEEVTYLLRFAAGLSVAYLMVASNVTGAEGGFDFAWPGVAFVEETTQEYRLTALLGLVAGTALWWRGGSLAWKEFPIESLNFSFRLGVFCLFMAVTVDILHPARLNTFPMIFLFFAAGLGGLSVGHLLPESRQAEEKRAWPRVIGGVVASVIGIGLVFSFLHRDMLSVLSRPALSLLDTVVTGAFWGLIIPISTVWNVLVEAVLGIFEAAFGGLRDSESNRRLQATVAERAEEAEQAEEESGEIIALVVQIVEWIVLAIVVMVLLYLLYRFLRKLLARGPKSTLGQRDSLRPDSDLKSDVGRLLLRLIPSWVGPRRAGPGFHIPDGPPGVVDALVLYYDMLTAAQQKGLGRHHHQTPHEYEATLASVFPKGLVSKATSAFVRACYGNHPAAREQIAEMSATLKSISTGTPVTGSRPQAPDDHADDVQGPR